MENKLFAYFGFAKRAGRLTLGVNAVKAMRGKAFLLVYDETASPNTQKEIAVLQKKLGCPLLKTRELEALTGKTACKLAAVRDEQLARAIFCTLDTDIK